MTSIYDRFFAMTENSSIARNSFLLSFLAPSCFALLLIFAKIFILSLLPLVLYAFFVAVAVTRRVTILDSLSFPQKVNRVAITKLEAGIWQTKRFYRATIQLAEGRKYSFRVPESEIRETYLDIVRLFSKASIDFSDSNHPEVRNGVAEMIPSHERFVVMAGNTTIVRNTFLLSLLASCCFALLLILARSFILSLLPFVLYICLVVVALVREQLVRDSLSFPQKVKRIVISKPMVGNWRQGRFHRITIHLDTGRKYSFRVPESEIGYVTSVVADLFPADSIDFQHDGTTNV